MKAFDLSVIIPIYNRADVVKFTFESVRRASSGLDIEIIVVDDGSKVPVAELLDRIGYTATQLKRQENRGLLFARLAGLQLASGRYVQFLDCDDLVSTDKFSSQISRMDACHADVSYSNTSRTVLRGDFDNLEIQNDAELKPTEDSAEFFIDIQPAPHSPIFRREYLTDIVRTASFPPSSLYNPVAEIWFYHIAALRPAKVIHVPGPRAIIGCHSDTRLTSNWERLGVASLAVMEAFARTTPRSADTLYVRDLVAQKAFRSWRALPRDFSPEFSRRLLMIWQRLHSPHRPLRIGGTRFDLLAKILGPVAAGRITRRLQNAPYSQCRTISDEELITLLHKLPSPDSANT